MSVAFNGSTTGVIGYADSEYDIILNFNLEVTFPTNIHMSDFDLNHIQNTLRLLALSELLFTLYLYSVWGKVTSKLKFKELTSQQKILIT